MNTETPRTVEAEGLTWARVWLDDYCQDGEWAYGTSYKSLRLSIGYNDGGPVAWVGHATLDNWIDSIACDGTIEGGARRAVALAEEVLANPKLLAALERPVPDEAEHAYEPLQTDNEELDAALAEVLRRKLEEDHSWAAGKWPEIPRFTACLNAAALLERRLTDSEFHKYRWMMWETSAGNSVTDQEKNYLLASARKRSEILYRVLIENNEP